MPFSDHILSPIQVQQRSTDKLGHVLQIAPAAFQQMLTNNGFDRRIANHWLVEHCAEALQNALPSAQVSIASVHIERESLQGINLNNRQLVQLSDEELLNADPNFLIASKAIVTIDVQGLGDDYRPTLAINMGPEGEEIAFGTTVNICTNFTILSANRRMSTLQRHRDRSKPRLTTSDLLKQIEALIGHTEAVYASDLTAIDQLKQQPVTRRQWHELAGELFSQVHYVNRQRLARNIAAVSEEEKALPVTANLLANIVAEARQPSHEVYAWEGNETNRWNLVNFGTEQIKLQHGVPGNSWLQTSAAWAELIQQRSFN